VRGRARLTDGARAAFGHPHPAILLCHQSLSSRHSPSKPNVAIAIPSSASRGNASPFRRATRFVPVDAAQMRNSSSDVTW